MTIRFNDTRFWIFVVGAGALRNRIKYWDEVVLITFVSRNKIDSMMIVK